MNPFFTPPVISIVIGSYNRKPFLKRTLSSIRNNGIKVPHEIIVVDGGSRDGSPRFLITQKDAITIVQHNHAEMFKGKKLARTTWGYFMNIGFRAAHGKYILMLSDDTLLLPDAVMNGYRQFEQRLQEGVPLGALAFYFRNYPGDQEYFIAKTAGGTIYVNHGLYLAKALQDINYLDEKNYFFYHGDADVCLRLTEAGYETAACTTAFVEHFKHASRSNRREFDEEHKRGWEYFKSRWSSRIPDLKLATEKNINTKEYLAHHDPSDTARHFRTTYAYWRYQAYRRAVALKKMLKHRSP